MSPDYPRLMQHAIDAARRGIAVEQTPFGAVIATTDGHVIAEAHNEVRAACDVTAHAEVLAIRRACRHLGTIDLSGHVIVTTCEPCPMCATAIHWARLDAVAYGASIEDAQAAGFNELPVPVARLYAKGHSPVAIYAGVHREACAALFADWHKGPQPLPY